MNHRKIFTLLLTGLVFSLLLDYFIDLNQLFNTLISADILFLSLAIVFMIIALMTRFLGWYTLFQLTNPKLQWTYIGFVYIASLGTKYVTPGGGLAIHPLFSKQIAEKHDAQFERVFSTMTIADILVILPLIILGSISTTYILQQLIQITHVFIGLGIIVALILFYKIYPLIQQRLSTYITLPDMSNISIRSIDISGRISKYQTMMNRIYTNLQTIRSSPFDIGVTLTYGLLSALSIGLVFWFSAVAIGVVMPLLAGLMIGIGSQAGRFIPTPAGGIEFLGILLMLTYTTAQTPEAISTIIVFRFISYWSIVGIGLLMTSQSDVSIKNSDTDTKINEKEAESQQSEE